MTHVTIERAKMQLALEALAPLEKLFTQADEQGLLTGANVDCQIATIELRKSAYAASDIRAHLNTAPTAAQPAPSHPDDLAVDRFASAMKTKMAKQRAKGHGGWDNKDECPTERLQTMLTDHLAKGDPIDVGNFAMMLWDLGESTAAAPVTQPSPVLSAGPITPEMAKWGEVEKAELVSVIAMHPAPGDQAPKKS